MSRYNDIAILSKKQKGKNNKNINFVANTKYPDVPLSLNDIYVYTTEGDRLDILAQQYYSDSSLWWVISIANPQLTQGSYYVPIGTQLRIPSDIESIKNALNELNKF
jgi:phage tail protein X